MKKNYTLLCLCLCFFSYSKAQTVNLTFALDAYYNFTNQSLDDSGPYFQNLGNNNGATPSVDRFGITDGAYSFDGIDDYLNAGDNTPLNPGIKATFSLWVNVPDAATNQKVMGKLPSGLNFGVNEGGYLIGVENNKASVEMWDDAGTHFSMQNGIIPANTWTHILVTYETTDYMRLYVNAVLVDSAIVAGPIGANLNDLIIGAAPWDPQYFRTTGAVDDIRIYHRVVNNAEVQALYEEVVTNNKNIATENKIKLLNNDGNYIINTTNNNALKNIKVYDLSGKLIANTNLSNQTSYIINLDNLANGLYMAEIATNTGVEYLKLIK
jgi:hypothetical protein